MTTKDIKTTIVGKTVVFNNGNSGQIERILTSDGTLGVVVQGDDGKTYIFSDTINPKLTYQRNTLHKVDLA